MRRQRTDEAATLGENTVGKGVILATLALLALGVVMVNSALSTVDEPGAWYARTTVRHTVFAVLAMGVLLVAWRFNYRLLAIGSRWPIVATVLLGIALVVGSLVYVPGLGHSVGGYHRWIRVGPSAYKIQFQPSELVKVSMVIFLAALLTRKTRDSRQRTLYTIIAMGVVLACAGLIVTQDFGTAAIIGIVGMVTMLLAGVRWYYPAGMAVPAAGAFYMLVIQSPYRMGRIQAMLDPWSLENPAAYQPRQSLLALLTGGWAGVGPGKGMMKLKFLPEPSTDYIFSAFSEEWGLIGAVILIGLVVAWVWCVRRAARGRSDPFGRVLAGALGFMIVLQMVLHVAVNLAVLPPTGIGMPFVSAGGTRLLIMAAATAMIVSVSSRGQPESLAQGQPQVMVG